MLQHAKCHPAPKLQLHPEWESQLNRWKFSFRRCQARAAYVARVCTIGDRFDLWEVGALFAATRVPPAEPHCQQLTDICQYRRSLFSQVGCSLAVIMNHRLLFSTSRKHIVGQVFKPRIRARIRGPNGRNALLGTIFKYSETFDALSDFECILEFSLGVMV